VLPLIERSPAKIREGAATARRLALTLSPRDAAVLKKIALELHAQADAAEAVADNVGRRNWDATSAPRPCSNFKVMPKRCDTRTPTLRCASAAAELPFTASPP
jgi:hypothetical protein